MSYVRSVGNRNIYTLHICKYLTPSDPKTLRPQYPPPPPPLHMHLIKLYSHQQETRWQILATNPRNYNLRKETR